MPPEDACVYVAFLAASCACHGLVLETNHAIRLFPQIRGPFCGCSCNKIPAIWGPFWGS